MQLAALFEHIGVRIVALQGPVKPFNDPLLAVVVGSAAPHLYIMFRQQLAECAHELTSRVNLQKSRPSDRPALVDATKRSGNLGCTLMSQRLSFFVAEATSTTVSANL